MRRVNQLCCTEAGSGVSLEPHGRLDPNTAASYEAEPAEN